MTTYGFTLQLDGMPADDAWFDQFCEAVFPHAPDSTPHRCNGINYLGFDREAPSLREAVLSAVASVHRADSSVTVVGVVLDDGQPLEDLLRTAAA
jgi:hypothetical protein